jgi:hypothetical protein
VTTEQAAVTMPKPMYTVLVTMESYDSESPVVPLGDVGQLLDDGFNDKPLTRRPKRRIGDPPVDAAELRAATSRGSARNSRQWWC